MSKLFNERDNSATELDFEKHWSSINVQQEVLRGVELRELKPKKNYTEYDSVNISFPSCSKRSGEALLRRNKTRKVIKKCRLKFKDRHCPLRIVELAEPSKRHCLNTWKNNYQTLPDYMVERLRKHIMDERPVVRISEAVNYFKNKRALSKKSSTSQSKTRSNKTQDLNMMLCTQFTYKIAQKLNTSVNIILNAELENISRVVTDELNDIVRYKKKNGTNNYKNKRILNEMAKKVTIWITDILEETSYKQLLEQLEEMEEEEGPVLDILDELLENVKMICTTPEPSDSILNQDNDSISVSLSTEIIDNDSAIEDMSKETTNFNESDHDVTQQKFTIAPENENNYNYSKENEPMDESFGIKEQIRDLLEEIINYIVNDMENTMINNNDIINSAETTNLLLNSMIENSTHDQNDDETVKNQNNLAPRIDNENIDSKDIIISELDKETGFTLEDPLDVAVENVHVQDDVKLHSDTNSPNGKNKLSVEDLDEETKKVKFSNIDMGNGENWTRLNKHSSDITYDYKEPVVWKSSKDYILSHFNVAPPNPNLLSYIDEVWPEYILPPLLKATESVNKSVTSLGRIMEIDDENILQSPTQKNRMDNTAKLFNKQLNTAIINLTDEGENMKKNETKVEKSSNSNYTKKDVDKQLQENHQLKLKQLSSPLQIDEDNHVKIQHNKDEDILKTKLSNKDIAQYGNKEQNWELSENQIYAEDEQRAKNIQAQDILHFWKKQTLQECGDVKSIKSNISIEPEITKKSPTNEFTKHTLKDRSKTPVNKKIMTVSKAIQTSFETNFENEEFYTKNNVDIQKWCMGLQNVTENLKLWEKWIQNVCSNIMYLKREGMSLKTCPWKNKYLKKWVHLKENLDADVQQWSQVGTKLRYGLRTYKKRYLATRKQTSLPANNNRCKCNSSLQKNSLCSQIVFENFYRTRV